MSNRSRYVFVFLFVPQSHRWWHQGNSNHLCIKPLAQVAVQSVAYESPLLIVATLLNLSKELVKWVIVLSCQVRRMTRTNHSTEVYLYYRRHFGFGKQRRGSYQGLWAQPDALLGFFRCHGKGTVGSFEGLSWKQSVLVPEDSRRVQARSCETSSTTCGWWF